MASGSETDTGSPALITPAELEALRGTDMRLIEIAGLRQDEMQSYREGHVPGAVCYLWKQWLWDETDRDFPDPDEFARRMGAAGIGNDTTVVLYGYDVQFGIYAWWALKYCGHADVRILDGAKAGWVADGRELETTFVEPPKESVAYRPVARVEAMRIGRDAVLSSLDSAGLSIVDARSPEEYSGERVGGPGGSDHGAVRYGRIPGAKHLFFKDLLDEKNAFRSADELRALLAEKGVKEDDRVIAYCRMSHRATVAYFALSQILGYEDVRVYDGSWTEWGNLVGVPVER